MNTHIVTIPGKHLLQIVFDIRVSQDGLLPNGNVIIAANHHNWVDPLLVALFWPDDLDLMYIGPRDANANTVWKKWLYDRYPGVILTEQRWGWPGRNAYRSALHGLTSGKSLMIFPEGDAFPLEGQVQPFANGAIHFAMKTGTTIIPVGLCGTAELYYRKPLLMRIGTPLVVSQTSQISKARLAEIKETLHEKVSDLIRDYHDPQVARKPMRWLTHLL
jgi:1-acyl-sn-glycerol-3-phosphate acyltransferase